MSYFEVQVAIRYETQGAKGATRIKTVKENYLVDAESVTEAEARVVEDFTKAGFSQDYEVVGVKASKIQKFIKYISSKRISNDKNIGEDLQDLSDRNEE